MVCDPAKGRSRVPSPPRPNERVRLAVGQLCVAVRCCAWRSVARRGRARLGAAGLLGCWTVALGEAFYGVEMMLGTMLVRNMCSLSRVHQVRISCTGFSHLVDIGGPRDLTRARFIICGVLLVATLGIGLSNCVHPIVLLYLGTRDLFV
jgi:hypothetical protein